MNAALQQAWLKWSEMDDMNELATAYAKAAFEAGWTAAIAQPEVERSTPAGSTNPSSFPWSEETMHTELGKVELISCDAQLQWIGPEIPLPPPRITAEDVYAAYPRKVGRGAAIKAIQKAAKIIGPKATSMTRFCPYAVLLERTQAFAKATASWPEADRHFICHPATWFNQERYNDDPKEWERGTAPASQFSVSH